MSFDRTILPFVFCIKVPAFELTHTLTHLWSDSSGTAILYRWNADGNFSAGRHEFSSAARISWLDSTVSYCETSFLKGDFFAEYKNRRFGLSGDFYWFYGNVENPYTGQYGAEFLYKNHEFNSSFCAGTVHILNNEDSRLVGSSYNLFSVLYRQTWYAARAMFKPYSGCAFFFGDFNGALTSENQLYFMYPYKYYKVHGDIQAFAVLAGILFEYRRNSFLFSLDCNSIFFANQNGSYDVKWRYKKNILFDGSSGSDSGNIDFMNKTGLVSVNSKCAYDICFSKLNMNVFLSKIWLIPFRISEGTGSGGTFEDSDGGISENLAFSWLFSGISAGLSINF